MALLPTDKLGQTMLFLIIIGAGAVYLYYEYMYGPQRESVVEMQLRLDSLQTEIAEARAELQEGTAEDVNRRLGRYRASLRLMRTLVPTRNEVPNLLDDIASRAKIRGVHLADWQPQGVQPGVPFDTDRYRFEAVGRYDAIGEFLSDIASLERVIVPSELSLSHAGNASQRAFADTSGSLLQVTFMVRTYIKSGETQAGGAGGSR